MGDKEKATVLEWLQWFYGNADFGPASEDVHCFMRQQFVEETGKDLPVGYGGEE
jgi:hypothetical protein